MKPIVKKGVDFTPCVSHLFIRVKIHQNRK